MKRRSLLQVLPSIMRGVGATNGRIAIVTEGLPGPDKLLDLAREALRQALSAPGMNRTAFGDRRIILKGGGDSPVSRSAESQAFRIRSIPGEVRVESSGIGLAYGAFRLAGLLRAGSLAADLDLRATPAFPERMFSYQGVLLDFPDESYYARSAPFVNLPVLREQVEAGKAAMRRLAGYSFNQIAFLSLNLEDFINYDRLGDGFTVYPADSMHRKRTPVFQSALKKLAEYAHLLHMEFWLQTYEFSLPDHLDGTHVTEASSYTGRIVQAKFDELLQSVPIDGIVVTPTEPEPRLNYRGFQLWKTPEGAGKMADLYQEAIVRKNRRRMVFRTWRVANDLPAFERMLNAAPDPEIAFDAKYTDGDFFLAVGPNKILAGGGPRTRRFTATFDTFTEFDGWGRTLFYPGFWTDRFRAFQAAGVRSVNAWGPWAPGCIYPGMWTRKYDAFDGVRLDDPAALPALCLFHRLAWEPKTSSADAADEWAKQQYGAAAGSISRALLLTEELWRTTYLTHDPASQIAFKWTMLFVARPDFVRKHASEWDLSGIQALNAKGISLARQINRLVREADFRDGDQTRADGMKRAAALTLLYFETFAPWRELIYRVYRADPISEADRIAALKLIDELLQIMPEWRRYPVEARKWLVLEFDPDLITAPEWLERTCAAETVARLRAKLKPKGDI